MKIGMPGCTEKGDLGLGKRGCLGNGIKTQGSCELPSKTCCKIRKREKREQEKRKGEQANSENTETRIMNQ